MFVGLNTQARVHRPRPMALTHARTLGGLHVAALGGDEVDHQLLRVDQVVVDPCVRAWVGVRVRRGVVVVSGVERTNNIAACRGLICCVGGERKPIVCPDGLLVETTIVMLT